MRDPELFLGRWARFFSTVLNAKPDNVDPDIGAGIPQQPIMHALGTEPMVAEVPATIRLMVKATNFQWSYQNWGCVMTR